MRTAPARALPALRRLTRGPDARVLSALLALLAFLTVLSWRRWGNPAFDQGNELAVADLVARGVVPYLEVRYYYGPLGLYALAGSFKALGTSLTSVWVLGYAQTLAVLATFYALARCWLSPAVAGLGTAVLMAIGFSGSIFNFVAPHTNSAIFGLVCLLAVMLALAHDRPIVAGLAAGASLLTRPEFAFFVAVVVAAFAIGRWRERGWRAGAAAALVPGLVGLALGGPVLAWLASRVGTRTLLFQSLFPLEFVQVSGARFARSRAPFTLESFVALGLKGLVYATLLAGLVVGALWWQRGRGAGRLRALLPPLAAVSALVALDVAARVTGALPAVRDDVEQDCVRLLIAMSWLPALAVAALARGLWRLRRGGAAPLGRSRAADLALLAAAAVCGMRTYADFTNDVASVYYAAPPVLLAAIAHDRLAARLPQVRLAALAPLALMAAALAFQGWYGRYRDNVVDVRTARGAYRAPEPAAGSIQGMLDVVRARSRPRDEILVVPDDGGVHFLSARDPALLNLTYLPGSLHPLRRERAAIAQLRRERPPLVVIGARHFFSYGYDAIGVDYNRELIAYVLSAYHPIATFGAYENPPRGSVPSEAFRVYELRR